MQASEEPAKEPSSRYPTTSDSVAPLPNGDSAESEQLEEAVSEALGQDGLSFLVWIVVPERG
jgi:hypothetical protein